MIVDTTPPDPFTPEIASDSALFGGQYFLVFAATDQQSGIDHYEVREGSSSWVTATSPYLLKDQTLSHSIAVRAFDKAGNFRLVRLPAEHPTPAPSPNAPFEWGIVIVLFVVLLFLIFLWKKRRSSKK
jgi:hypothetical protein